MALTEWTSILTYLGLMTATAFVGSWHCAGMCGPVALLMGPGRGQFFYQLGRLTGYLILGFVAGTFGQQLMELAPAYFHSPALWLVVGGFAVLLAFSLPGVAKSLRAYLPKVTRSVPPLLRPLAIGLGTALFPCGWLWTFVAAGAITGSAVTAMLVMASLWLGGLPVLLGFSRVRNFFVRLIPPSWNTGFAVGLWIAGLWGLAAHLILR